VKKLTEQTRDKWGAFGSPRNNPGAPELRLGPEFQPPQTLQIYTIISSLTGLQALQSVKMRGRKDSKILPCQMAIFFHPKIMLKSPHSLNTGTH